MEERIIWRKRFQAQSFDFRGKLVLTRFDCCEFVKCTVLIDHGTEQLAFTACAFKDCNIDQLQAAEGRGLYVRDNVFHRPLEERRAEFEHKLAQALAASGSRNRRFVGALVLFVAHKDEATAGYVAGKHG